MRKAVLLLCASLAACTSSIDEKMRAQERAGAASAEGASPQDAPLQYRVLADNIDRASNTVDQHLLLLAPPKHDQLEDLLRYLYRHLMTRQSTPPAALSVSVYSDEAQYKTPPRSPIGSVTKRSGDVGPTFENKIPLEFSQQIEEAMPPKKPRGKLAPKVARDEAQKSVTVTYSYVEDNDHWADKLSFNQAMVVFTDVARQLFDKVPELRSLEYLGRWKDADVVKISLTRAQYQAANLADIEDQIGQIHGRAVLELGASSSDAKVQKATAQRMAAVYKKMLGTWKGHAWVSPALKL
jgi:hypothetical protein